MLIKYQIGRIACFMVFSLSMVYVVITAIGLLSLPNPHEPISDPYYTIMEVLSILIPLLMSISLAAIHSVLPDERKFYSRMSLVLLGITTGITSCVHTTVLCMRYYMPVDRMADLDYLFSFKWPSVVYALDILAWDWFFALSLFFAAAAFQGDKSSSTIRVLLGVSGLLSLIGLLGVPLNTMQVRNIGILGYAVIAPFAFLTMARKLRLP